MGKYTAIVSWERNGATFTDNRYSRGHRWQFDGGIEVPASSSPQVVPLPQSVVAAVDPEEAFVVALSSCHMLWFLSIAANRGFLVESYRDEAIGVMGKNAAGKQAMTHVTLRPAVMFGGQNRPHPDEVKSMHHEAHAQCFIASSVTTDVRCEPMEHMETAAKEELTRYFLHLAGRVERVVRTLSPEKFWVKPYTYGNSIGHLVLHLTGSLSHISALGSQGPGTSGTALQSLRTRLPSRPKLSSSGFRKSSNSSSRYYASIVTWS